MKCSIVNNKNTNNYNNNFIHEILTSTKLQTNIKLETHTRKRVFINAYWLTSPISSPLNTRTTSTGDGQSIKTGKTTNVAVDINTDANGNKDDTVAITTAVHNNNNNDYNNRAGGLSGSSLDLLTLLPNTLKKYHINTDNLTSAQTTGGNVRYSDILTTGNVPVRTFCVYGKECGLSNSQLAAMDQRPLFDLEEGIIGRVLSYV
uniref:Uncharacterized protein n=1 Tax=Melicertus latisulcatus majanivirus TaxID=2984277 RepID=A0A9C7CD95_9VIRU|nr:MAG: hypothetical protein [Melicertus latisulcatus majanivirus]